MDYRKSDSIIDNGTCYSFVNLDVQDLHIACTVRTMSGIIAHATREVLWEIPPLSILSINERSGNFLFPSLS